MSEVRIIIVAKAPVPGEVKTRLVPALGEQGAAQLAREMLLNTIAEAIAAGVGPTEICGDPAPPDPSWDNLLADCTIERSGQGQGDLGERLARVAERTISAGAAPLLIGSDCPALDRHGLCAIAAQLQDHDAVIQPALDGGYVALGLKRFHPTLFRDIAWSTSSVAEQTIERIRVLGWSLFVGPALRDIDEPADLDALRDCS